MTSPIKVGDIVRVTGVDEVAEHTGGYVTAYDLEPLNHGTLTDIEAASVMLERAHHRIGELTRERDDARGGVEAVERGALVVARASLDALLLLSGASGPETLPEAAARVARERDAHAARNRGATQAIVEAIGSVGPESVEDAVARVLARLTKAEAEAERLTEDRDNARVERDRERDLRKAAERALAEARAETKRAEVDRNAAVRNCALTQSRYDALRFELGERDTLRARLDAIETALCDACDSGICAPPIDDWRGYCAAILAFKRGEVTDLAAELHRSQDGKGAHTTTREPNGYDPGARPSTEKSSDPHAWKVGEWVRATVDGVPVGVPFQVRAMDIERGWLKNVCRWDAQGTLATPAPGPEWAAPGVWAVWDGMVKHRPAVRLTERAEGEPFDWWGVRTDGTQDNCWSGLRRPATPEETARFEAELQRNPEPKVRLSTSVLGAAIAWAGCLAEAVGWGMPAPIDQACMREWMEEMFDLAHRHALREKCGDLVDAWDLAAPFQDWLDAGAPETWPVKPDTTPTALAVGQRWVFVAQPLDDQIEEGPADADDIITNLRPSARGETVVVSITARPSSRHTDWSEGRFRDHHPRLRLPEELEPAPASPAPQQATPPAEPKTSLPGRGEP